MVVDIETEHKTAVRGAAGYKDLFSVVVLGSVYPVQLVGDSTKSSIVYTSHKLSVKKLTTPCMNFPPVTKPTSHGKLGGDCEPC